MLHIPLDVPDLWQQEAARALRDGRDVIVDAPTGAGKTRIFELHVESGAAARRGQSVYTVPTRALANDKWREWRERGWNVGLVTGDIVVNPDAPVLVATLETQRERILDRRAPALVVIDEYQMIADARRGLNYELLPALADLSTQLLLLSGSVRNPGDIDEWLRRLGRSTHLTIERERPVPLEEFPVENLPRVPDSITGVWPRIAAATLAAGLTPLLVFAPRRPEAEKIARAIAGALPADDPISLRPEHERILGRDLASLVARRVAYHHSGLPYAARAGWIEPLAKNGHLRVIVATTGLAAGINFSVRSVLVAGTTYFDGPFQRELRADELLQMFGRAGRRGLDTKGFVLSARNTPRLFDAAPRQLRRVNELDWPTLLRVMEEAAARAEPPLEAASKLGARLFSRQQVSLGFDHPAGDADAPDRFGPTREEFLDSTEHWRPVSESREAAAPLSECLVRHRDKWQPATKVPSTAGKYGPGRLCRIPEARGFHYGREIAVATRCPDGRLRPLPWLRRQLHLDPHEAFADSDFLSTIPALLELGGATPLGLVNRGGTIALQLEIGSIRESVRLDARKQALIDAPRRRVAVAGETLYGDFRPRPGTPAHAWRRLGLVDAAGVPTGRGRVFSRFQAGEGLVVAAALEDPAYNLDELVCHLANLRAGHRFGEGTGASDRLAAASRAAYGHVDYEGYLRAGLCEGYGEAAWEIIERFLASGRRPPAAERVSAGDVERAVLEWLSLLRHIVHASDPAVPRWDEFREAAASRLRTQPAPEISFENDLPAPLRQRATERGPRAFTR